MARSKIEIKAGDSLEVGLHTDKNGSDVVLGVNTAKALNGKYEPFILCADQADEVALSLIRAAAELRAIEEAAKAMRASGATEVAA